MKGIAGYRRASKRKRFERLVRAAIRDYPDLWPAAVVHGQESWKDMPADQFDWALEQAGQRWGDARLPTRSKP